MIQAVIFDMDGVLIDSEPLWREAEVRVFKRVGLHVTPEMCQETMGRRVDEVVRCRYQKQPWKNKSLKEVETEILDELEELIIEQGMPMPGVHYILDFFQSRNIRRALASSSYMRVIETILSRLGLQDAFEVIHSGEFEQNGKPHPAIYRSTLGKLNLTASEAIAFEDSYNGLLSAKVAKLSTVAIPEQSVWHESKFAIADVKLKSLLEFDEAHLHFLNTLT